MKQQRIRELVGFRQRAVVEPDIEPSSQAEAWAGSMYAKYGAFTWTRVRDQKQLLTQSAQTYKLAEDVAIHQTSRIQHMKP